VQTVTFNLAGARLELEVPDGVPLAALTISVGVDLNGVTTEQFLEIVGELDGAELEVDPSWSTTPLVAINAHAEGAHASMYVYPPDAERPAPKPRSPALAALRERLEAKAPTA
jgi:hypothetical protein